MNNKNDLESYQFDEADLEAFKKYENDQYFKCTLYTSMFFVAASIYGAVRIHEGNIQEGLNIIYTGIIVGGIGELIKSKIN